MAASDVPWLGQRIREQRLKRGISLRALARDVGVSASMISQIETAKSQPSVSTLYAITNALAVSVEDLFTAAEDAADPNSADPNSAEQNGADPNGADPNGADPNGAEANGAEQNAAALDGAADRPGVQQGNGVPTTVVEALGSFAADRLGPVVAGGERPVLQLDSGVTWELLGKLPHHAVDFLLITYAPGGTSSSTAGLMRHPGSEFGYLLRGELTVTLGFEQHTLRAGESISFDSTTPHSYRNDGTLPAVGVWFVVEYDVH